MLFAADASACDMTFSTTNEHTARWYRHRAVCLSKIDCMRADELALLDLLLHCPTERLITMVRASRAVSRPFLRRSDHPLGRRTPRCADDGLSRLLPFA